MTTDEINTLSLHDALPIYQELAGIPVDVDRPEADELAACLLEDAEDVAVNAVVTGDVVGELAARISTRRQVDHGGLACVAKDRKSTRLNSSHVEMSYAVFC